jgi:hypothetical protein
MPTSGEVGDSDRTAVFRSDVERYNLTVEVPMITLTPELREAIEQAGKEPVRLEDPVNHSAYVLLSEETYQQLKPSGHTQQAFLPKIPEGILRSQKAFLRDLPKLLEDESLRGQWVCYHGDERIGVAPKAEPLIRECLSRGLKRDQYDLLVIEETEEVDFPSPWLS